MTGARPARRHEDRDKPHSQLHGRDIVRFIATAPHGVRIRACSTARRSRRHKERAHSADDSVGERPARRPEVRDGLPNVHRERQPQQGLLDGQKGSRLSDSRVARFARRFRVRDTERSMTTVRLISRPARRLEARDAPATECATVRRSRLVPVLAPRSALTGSQGLLDGYKLETTSSST